MSTVKWIPEDPIDKLLGELRTLERTQPYEYEMLDCVTLDGLCGRCVICHITACGAFTPSHHDVMAGAGGIESGRAGQDACYTNLTCSTT